MTHLNIWNTSYGQKKGWELNGQFDSRALKIKNRPNLLTVMWLATCCWKAFDDGYNFGLEFVSMEGLHTKLGGPKIAKILTLAISGLPGQKAI
jgi:hypothetical protein